MVLLDFKYEPDEDFRHCDDKYVPLGVEGPSLFECFIVWIDPYLSYSECDTKLQEIVHPTIQALFDPYATHFQFHSEPGTFEICKGGKNGNIPYIYFSQECPFSLDEEFLRQFFWHACKMESFKDVFMLYGDEQFLLNKVESRFDIPSTITPNNSKNRLWWNAGRCVVIQADLSDQKISVENAIAYLNKQGYKVHILDLLATYLNQCETTSILKCLGTINDVPNVNISRQIANMFANYPWMVAFSFMHHVPGTETVTLDAGINFHDKVKVDIGIPNWISKIVDENKLVISDFLTEGFTRVLAKYPSIKVEFGNIGPSYDEINLSRRKFQQILIDMGVIKDEVAESRYLPESVNNREEEMMEDVTLFFENKEEISMQILQELNETGESEHDEVPQEETLNSNNHEFDGNFDEDDFFEFFLKNALKVKESDLDNYRREEKSDYIQESLLKRKYNDDSDYSSDGEEFTTGNDQGNGQGNNENITEIQQLLNRLQT